MAEIPQATVLDALKGVSMYPIAPRTIAEVMERRGLTYSDLATKDILEGRAYNLAVADLLVWLSLAPNTTLSGQSFSFTDDQRDEFRRRARLLYDEFDEDDAAAGRFGYKGEWL